MLAPSAAPTVHRFDGVSRRLRRALMEEGRTAGEAILDLGGIDSLDLKALAWLEDVHAAAERAGGRLRLIHVGLELQALLELVGFDHLLNAEALAAGARSDAAPPSLLRQFGTSASPAAVWSMDATSGANGIEPQGERFAGAPATSRRIDLMERVFGAPIDHADHDEVLSIVLQRSPELPFAYVVTPNVDHVVRLDEQRERLERCYQEAWLSVCDSSVLVALARLLGTKVPLVTGSDLAAALFDRLDPADTVTVIGCEPEVVQAIKNRYGLERVNHYNPPMGFITDEAEVQACVDFVIDHPARFVIFCVGSPQQEILANRLLHAGGAVGVGFCVGSALRFLAGGEERAPKALRGSGLEWAYRLAQDPKRLWRRYLVEGPRILQIAASRLLCA